MENDRSRREETLPQGQFPSRYHNDSWIWLFTYFASHKPSRNQVGIIITMTQKYLSQPNFTTTMQSSRWQFWLLLSTSKKNLRPHHRISLRLYHGVFWLGTPINALILIQIQIQNLLLDYCMQTYTSFYPSLKTSRTKGVDAFDYFH